MACSHEELGVLARYFVVWQHQAVGPIPTDLIGGSAELNRDGPLAIQPELDELSCFLGHRLCHDLRIV